VSYSPPAVAPGTYAGKEIAYGESLVLTSTVAVNTPVDVPNAVLTVPAGIRPVRLMWEGTVYNGTAGGVTALDLLVDGARVRRAQAASVAANEIHEIVDFHRLAPSAIDRVVKVQITALLGTANVQAQVAGQPCALWAIEC